MNQLRHLMLATIAVCGLWAATASAQTQRQIIVVNPPPAVDLNKPLVFKTYLDLPFDQLIRLPNPQDYTARPSSVQPASFIVPASAETTPSTPQQQIISVPVYAQPVVNVPVYVEPEPYDPYYYQPWVIPALGINRSNWGLDNARPIGRYRR
jgi:hypothetical protein